METLVVVCVGACTRWSLDGHVLAIKGSDTVGEVPQPLEVVCYPVPLGGVRCLEENWSQGLKFVVSIKNKCINAYCSFPHWQKHYTKLVLFGAYITISQRVLRSGTCKFSEQIVQNQSYL